ncbi:MAG: metallopeptidase TldD-related protein, partial [Gemmatimonadales bacterium]
MSRAALRAAGRVLGAGAALTLLPVRGPAQASGDAVLRAMRDELARSTTELRLDTLPKPYFVAYRVEEIEHAEVSASLGSLLSSEEIRLRRLTVELRVGDYAFDNTNFFGMPGGPSGVLRGFGGAVSLPLDDDYREVRRQLWLATDAAYKAAVEDLGRKRAALQGRVASEYVPDFSREERTSVRDEVAVPRPSRAAAESLVRDLSALFRHVPEVHRSVAEWQGGVVRTWYLNSEGTSFVRTWPWVGVHVRASTQAADGRELEDFVAARGAAPADLPGRAELVTGVRELAARLTRLRQAPLAEAYNGPILFEGQAAAELFHQVFAPRLVSSRRPVSDHPMFDRFAEREENPFLDRVGGRVLPRFLSVTDDATTRRAEGRALWGFRVDDDGVPAQATRVVERGILRTLLTARVPVRGHPRSTGNRWGDG